MHVSIEFIFSIAVKVVPRSIKHGNIHDCEHKVPLEIPHDPLPVSQQLDVTYTYSVTFIVSIRIMNLRILDLLSIWLRFFLGKQYNQMVI